MLGDFQECSPERAKAVHPFKSKGSRQSNKPPWLNCELLLKTRVYQMWKSGQVPAENYRGIARVCRDAKAELELKLAGDVKNYKKGLFRYRNNKQKQKEIFVSLLSRRGELVANNAETGEILSTFFTNLYQHC